MENSLPRLVSLGFEIMCPYGRRFWFHLHITKITSSNVVANILTERYVPDVSFHMHLTKGFKMSAIQCNWLTYLTLHFRSWKTSRFSVLSHLTVDWLLELPAVKRTLCVRCCRCKCPTFSSSITYCKMNKLTFWNTVKWKYKPLCINQYMNVTWK